MNARRAAWLLGLALNLASESEDRDAAVTELITSAEGDRQCLEGAYGRALALASALPDDGNAQLALDLLRRAMRQDEIAF